jgi:hypothetical protein
LTIDEARPKIYAENKRKGLGLACINLHSGRGGLVSALRFSSVK